MRVFALSDLHVDYAANRQWVANLSSGEYRDDVLILAGDVSHSLPQVEWCLKRLVQRFAAVLCVPGNHDLWVLREPGGLDSLQKFHRFRELAESCGASTQAFHRGGLSIVPMFSWYDHSFGEPTRNLILSWVDYRACRWPEPYSLPDVAAYFATLNEPLLATTNDIVISFSHFLPRIDLMPGEVPVERQMLYPVLGTTWLEAQIRRLMPRLHIYGHSHLNRRLTLDGITYINNAFGYPHEGRITAKELLCVHEA